ncbi:hypothetical protein E4U13_008346, partial [Claviceps humidiphila]
MGLRLVTVIRLAAVDGRLGFASAVDVHRATLPHGAGFCLRCQCSGSSSAPRSLHPICNGDRNERCGHEPLGDLVQRSIAMPLCHGT